MADTVAVRALERRNERIDAHIRALLSAQETSAGVEINTALMQLGNGSSVISTGIVGAWSFDFRAVITGWFIQEFDGTSGSIELDLAKDQRGVSPTFVSIVASAPPTVTSARYAEDATLVGWTTLIERGDIIRIEVASVASFTRVLIGLRIQRLEP
jgi:hypothetical protein